MSTTKNIYEEQLLDDVGLSPNCLYLLYERFLLRNENGEISETPAGMFRRVARTLAAAEPMEGRQRWEERFYDVMKALEFHPATRVLANAGTNHPQLQNCFVFPLQDSQAGIMRTLSESTLVKSHGGGCGFNYSDIRPQGDPVHGIPNLAVGPVKLMRLFDLPTKLFRQQGRYESGNMAVLNVDHPDVCEFISAKKDDGTLSVTNISLGISDMFMQRVEEDGMWSLVNPKTHSVVKAVRARKIFEMACDYAATTGDPGLLFLDRMNEKNPLRGQLGDIRATNPCGEIGLYPYEACNLGYINLTTMLLPNCTQTPERPFDINRLRSTVMLAVRMIDNAISASWYPLESIRQITQANRRIGLGVTGWADCLAQIGIAYDSEEAIRLARQLAKDLYESALTASLALGREKGPFPNSNMTSWRNEKEQPRNVALLGFPPSGNNALIFNTAFSIEPFFGLSFVQTVMYGAKLRHLNQQLCRALEEVGIPIDGLAKEIEEEGGSIQGIRGMPDSVKRRFRTAYDIPPEWHVRMQAAFQEYVDNAITKTVNLHRNASGKEVEAIYKTAWRAGCKGITVYRDRSRSQQTISVAETSTTPNIHAGSCPTCEL